MILRRGRSGKRRASTIRPSCLRIFRRRTTTARRGISPVWRCPICRCLATRSGAFNLSVLGGRTILYIYPRTGVPGVDLPPGWDDIPGARGCTPQSCGFRDHFAELKALGVAHVFGLSTQDTDYQREAAERLHLPFPILSDAELKFTRALNLPTFTVAGMTLLKRMVLVIDDGVIGKVFYPVFPPDKSAAEVVAWLRRSGVELR